MERAGLGGKRLNHSGACLETAPPLGEGGGVTLQNKQNNHSNKPCNPFQATRGI